jgi:hypothetical protein
MPSAGLSVTTWTSRRHSRRTSITEKPRLTAAFGAFPIRHSLPFLVCLLLEPAVNEGALGRWSGRRFGGCVGASAGRSPLRAARTPTCCAMGPSPPTSLHEPAATCPSEQAAYVLELGGAAYSEAIYPSGRPVSGRGFSVSISVDRSLPRREQAQYSLRLLHHPPQRLSFLWKQTVLRPILHLSLCARTEKVYGQSFAAGTRLIWLFDGLRAEDASESSASPPSKRPATGSSSS